MSLYIPVKNTTIGQKDTRSVLSSTQWDVCQPIDSNPNGAIIPAEIEKEIYSPDLSSLPTSFFVSVLIVDDCADTRNLIKHSITKYLPFMVDMAENGEEAVEKWEANQYGIILMDVQMPVMNGYTATQIIRTAEVKRSLTRTPIIAVTGASFNGARRRSLEVGCDEHLDKPVRQSVLLNSILQLIAF